MIATVASFPVHSIGPVNLVVLRLVRRVRHLQCRLLTIAIAVAPVRPVLTVMTALHVRFKVIERIVGVGRVILPGRVGDQLFLENRNE